MSKVDKSDIREEVAASIRNFAQFARGDASRQRLIIDMPDFIQKKAALISAHFLLPAGARVVDMACETGEITYMLAALNPRIEFIGVDRDPTAISFARKTYRLPNLSYRLTDIAIPDLEDASVDGIINSNVLHHVYSAGGYNPEEVSHLLDRQIAKLKMGGTMLIRDFIMPPQDEYVLMEMPNLPSHGDDPLSLSDADLLIAFSQSARPMVSGCEGFFIEELVPRKDGTRLFRLPHKWAVEFIHRKNYRKNWARELHEEYTFYTWQDYRREFARLGMRMVFSAPHWNPWVVQNCFKGRFQLYDEDYAPQPPPATNSFIVAQKVDSNQSMIIEERRPSQKPVGELKIKVVRDVKSGKMHELVSRPGEFCDVVPYRITPDNRLIVYVRSGYPRPIVNAVSRGGHNLDGKKWSGHLIEPIMMDTTAMTTDVEDNRKQIFGYVSDYAGLRPKDDERWFVGSTYFPAPDRIDEAIEPVFVEVENPQRATWPIAADASIAFTEAGTITELDAADIILSSQVGLLPEPRLEMHIMELMARYNIDLPHWIGDSLPDIEKQAVKAQDPDELLEDVERSAFEEVSGAPTHLKPVKAVFVEEGRVGRTMRGLSAQDIEFIVTDDGVENIAVVLPLTRDWDNNLLVALEPTIMPVPNRLGGDGAMLNAPSFPLPKDVKTVEDARFFIAGKFRVPLDNVEPLGQSYFIHTGLTPQRIYPFIITAPVSSGSQPTWRLTMAKRLMDSRRGLGNFARFAPVLLKSIAKLQMRSMASEATGMERDMDASRHKGYELAVDKVEVNTRHASTSAVPSRILGQRAVDAPQAAATARVLESSAALSQAVAAADVPVQAPEVSPRVGRRLAESYAQAKSVMRAGAASITLSETAPVKKIDAAIGELGEKLRQAPPVVEAAAPVKKDTKDTVDRNKSGKDIAATLRAPARTVPDDKTPPAKSPSRPPVPQLDLGLTPPDKKRPR